MGQRKFRFGLAAGSLALLILGASPARAQLWLDPAYPGRSKLGPAKAAGAVIWSHGRSIDSEDSQAPIPPYMGTLRDGGWDTFRFNRMRASDTLAASARAPPPPPGPPPPPHSARLFGSCMLGFLDAAQIAEGARCDGDTFWAGAPQSLPIQPAVAAAGSAQGTAGQRPDRH